MRSYKFKGVVLVDLGSTSTGQHIPYFLCSEVVGPRGGTYVLDSVCTQTLLKAVTRDVTASESLLSEAYRQGKITGLRLNTKESSDVAVKNYAQQIKATPLIRKDGVVLAKKMATNFDMSFMSK